MVERTVEASRRQRRAINSSPIHSVYRNGRGVIQSSAGNGSIASAFSHFATVKATVNVNPAYDAEANRDPGAP